MDDIERIAELAHDDLVDLLFQSGYGLLLSQAELRRLLDSACAIFHERLWQIVRLALADRDRHHAMVLDLVTERAVETTIDQQNARVNKVCEN